MTNISTVLQANLTKHYSHDMARAIAEQWLGYVSSVARGSSFALPFLYSRKGLDKEFLDSLIDHLDYSGSIEELPILTDDIWVSKKDDAGFWVLFNTTTLEKKYFNFTSVGDLPIASNSPEKVYVSLLKDSLAMATGTAVYRVVKELQGNNVFEVHFLDDAIIYPDFKDLVDLCVTGGLSVSFTTSTLTWLKEPWSLHMLSKCSGFSYSVRTAKQVSRLADLLVKYSYPLTRVNITFQLAGTSLHEFEDILKVAYINGFSVTLRNSVDTRWINSVKKLREDGVLVELFVDNGVVSSYERSIHFMGASDFIKPLNVGKFSCYVDATSGTFSLSEDSDRDSFCAFDEDWITSYRNY